MLATHALRRRAHPGDTHDKCHGHARQQHDDPGDDRVKRDARDEGRDEGQRDDGTFGLTVHDQHIQQTTCQQLHTLVSARARLCARASACAGIM